MTAAMVKPDGAFASSAARRRQEVVLSAARPDGAWMLVQSNFRKERELKAAVLAQGYHVYLPMRLPMVSNNRAAPQLLLPGMLFIRLTPSVERWQALFSTRGFRSLFMTRGRPIGLRDAFIEHMRAQEIDGYLQVGLLGKAVAPKQGGRWAPLDQVVTALLAETVDEKRMMLLTSILSGDQRDTVDLSKLSRA